MGAALLFGPLVLRDRLPDPIASHWGFSGRPDDALPFGAMLVVQVLLWLVIAAVALGALVGSRFRRRAPRGWATVLLAAGGVFVLGLTALTTWANLDIAGWRAARPVNWQVAVVFACCLPAGLLGRYLGRLGPDERPERTTTAAVDRLVHARENVVWVSVTSNSALCAVGLVAAVVSLAGVISAVFGWLTISTAWTVIALGLAALVLLVLCSVHVQADRGGVRIAVGPARWPRRRIDLDDVEAAGVEQRRPRHVGGWGYRGLPGNATIMIRGGECLVLHYHDGGELGISVDDAERGAALINGLLAERSTTAG